VGKVRIDSELTAVFTITANSLVWCVEDFLVEEEDDFLDGLVDDEDEGAEEEEAL